VGSTDILSAFEVRKMPCPCQELKRDTLTVRNFKKRKKRYENGLECVTDSNIDGRDTKIIRQ